MKIIEVREIKGHYVESDEDDDYRYLRYGPDSWFVTMGDSDEPFYDCDEIESLFQEYIKKDNLITNKEKLCL